MTREQIAREIDFVDSIMQSHFNDYGEETNRALREAIDLIVQEPKWIPVSEKLPEERKAVLVQEAEYNNIYCAYLYDDTWFIYGSCRSYAVANVIAWMPLPEPKEPQESEKINCKTTICVNCKNHNYCDYEQQESEGT